MKKQFIRCIVLMVMIVLSYSSIFSCTGIRLKAKDGSVLYGRTLEWGAFDLNSRLMVVPRDHAFTALTPDGKSGLSWRAKLGAVGIDALEKPIRIDGINEKGLAVGAFYHPGFAQYQKYDPAQASISLGPTDVCHYLLTMCATVEDAKKAISAVSVVAVTEPALGFAPPLHYIVTEPSGKSIVIEFLKGKRRIFDAPLGVITNAPSYDWHETNVRNYLRLMPGACKKNGQLDFKPLGHGSGLVGLPGDFTPPSRFVRATVFTKSARQTSNGEEAMYEMFRILDNFNVPLSVSEDNSKKMLGMRSSTIWTTAYDLKHKVMYYHTQHNRRVRRVDVSKINFAKTKLTIMPLDKEKRQDMENVTPA